MIASTDRDGIPSKRKYERFFRRRSFQDSMCRVFQFSKPPNTTFQNPFGNFAAPVPIIKFPFDSFDGIRIENGLVRRR
jgi:hypothetical protein